MCELPKEVLDESLERLREHGKTTLKNPSRCLFHCGSFARLNKKMFSFPQRNTQIGYESPSVKLNRLKANLLGDPTFGKETDGVTYVDPLGYVISTRYLNTAGAGTSDRISVYVRDYYGAFNGRAAIYAAGLSLLGESGVKAMAAGWNDIPLTGVNIADNTQYYLALQVSFDCGIYWDAGAGGVGYDLAWAWGPFPSTLGGSFTNHLYPFHCDFSLVVKVKGFGDGLAWVE